ncbi:MAG: zinc ribbon domain-containing protein [Acidobacteriaceae bacterium]|nr:zinc ribbon domain-containing protein [Acidobacteriaceae bacterium]
MAGIEVKAHCPVLFTQYRMNKINLEIDGQPHVIAWDQPFYKDLAPGKHKVSANIQGLLTKGPTRHLDVTVEPGQITEVTYSLTLLSVINPGKLEVSGKRAAAPDPAQLRCPACGTALPAESRFCLKCGARIP